MRILVATDFSDFSLRAFPLASEFASAFEDQGSMIYLVSVEEFSIPSDIPDSIQHLLPGLSEVQQQLASRETDRLEKLREEYFSSVNSQTVLIERRKSVAEDLSDFALANAIDLIVLASHGRSGIAKLFGGSVTERLLALAPCPILILPTEVDAPPRDEALRVVLTSDLSAESSAAFPFARKLYQQLGNKKVQLTLVHICEDLTRATYGLSLGIDPEALADEREKLAYEQLEALVKNQLPGIPVITVVIQAAGAAGPAFREYVESHNVDLLISARHGHSGLEHSLFGGFSRMLVTSGKRPIVIVPV